MTTLAIVIVSWNVRDLLDRCITSLHASLAGSAITYTIVVADNASGDGTPQMLRDRHPEVRLIETGGNLGFGGGNNLAMRVLLEGPEPPELLLILNPDTEAVGDAIPTMVGWMQAHGDVAVVGPLLRYPDGSVQPSRRRLPTPGVFFMESTPLEWRWPDNRWARRYRMLDQPDTAAQDVDWLVGAALLVRRTAIAQAGLFDERLTLYSEELEWQRRLGQTGRIVFLPQAVVTHHEGQSSAQVPTRRLVLFHTNRLRYIRMAHGAPLALLVRAFLMVAYGAELLGEGGKWLIGHRRELRAQRVGAYASLLRALVVG